MLRLDQALRSSKAAVDLASIMVGVIIIALIGSLIAATVFVVIPWAQDNAAKQQLDAIVQAENTYRGLASDADVILKPAQLDEDEPEVAAPRDSYTDSAFLASNSLLALNPNYCVTAPTADSYVGYAKSASGAVFTATDKQTEPVPLTGNASTCLGEVVAGRLISAATTSSIFVPGSNASSQHFFTSKNGVLYGWGSNTSGQVGVNTVTNVRTPTPVTVPNVGFKQIAVSPSHTAALANNGQVYLWGENSNGQLGNGTYAGKVAVPTKLESPVLASKTVVAVTVNSTSTMVLTSKNRLYAWGAGYLGAAASNVSSNVPVAVDMTGQLAGKTIKSIGGISGGFIVLTTDGKVFTWGGPGNQLGTGSASTNPSPKPNQVKGLIEGKEIVSMSASSLTVLVVDKNGIAYGWGEYTGNNTSSSQRDPVLVKTQGTAMEGKTVKAVFAGRGQNYLVDMNGALYGWGYTASSNGTKTSVNAPALVDVSNLAGDKIVGVSSGNLCNMLVTETGKVYTWAAQNTYGELGNKTSAGAAAPNIPTLINLP